MQFKLPQALAISLAATQVSANLDAANIMDALTSLSASATELAEQASHADLGELAKQLIGQYSDILHSPLVHLQSAKRDLFPFLGIGHDVTASDPDSPVVQTAQSNRPSFVNNLSDTVHNIPDITADMSNADASGSNTVVDMTPNTPPVSAAKWAAAFTSLFAEISKMLSSTINGAMQTRPTKRGLPTDLCAELDDFVTSHQTLISKITTGPVSTSKHLSDAFGALLAEFSHEVGSFEQLLSLVNPTCATAAKAQLDALKQDAANASKVLSQ